MTDCKIEEEIDYDSLSVDELFNKGKELFKSQKYAESAEYFSRALEKKSGNNPTDPELREYYLWFADSLLTKEEHTSNIFSNNINEGTNEDSLPTAEAVINAANNDETLAFELFNIGHECYMNHLKDNKQPNHNDILDTTYCLIRIGDMYFTNNQFNEAAKEYGRALDMRIEHGMESKYLASLYISLAQSLMFDGQLNVSLKKFEKCCEILEDIIKKDGLEGDKLEDMKNTLEDVMIQIDDLKKMISKTSMGINGTNLKGSQCNAGEYVPKTTSTLDEKQLDPSMKVKLVDVNTANLDGKKRRIDLTSMYKNKN